MLSNLPELSGDTKGLYGALGLRFDSITMECRSGFHARPPAPLPPQHRVRAAANVTSNSEAGVGRWEELDMETQGRSALQVRRARNYLQTPGRCCTEVIGKAGACGGEIFGGFHFRWARVAKSFKRVAHQGYFCAR